MRYRIDEICSVIAAVAEGPPPEQAIEGFSIDSRTTRSGELFFAIKGENLDGHDFVARAFEGGASAAVVQRDFSLQGGGSSGGLIRCDDPLEALHRLAAHSRDEEEGLRLIGITGSCGKTTTKDIAAALLGRRLRTGKNEGNLNNLYGLPLAMLRRPPGLEAYVCELGMSFPGELKTITLIARPGVAVYTNIYGVHLMNFGSMWEIAKAKEEMLEGVPQNGIVVANADDPEVMRIAENSGRRMVTFSFQGDADIVAGGVDDRGVEGLVFELRVSGRKRKVQCPLPGVYNLQNLLAALGAGLALGFEPEGLLDGLEEIEISPSRSHLVEFEEGWTLFDDAYNSNPKALRDVLTTVIRSPGFSRRIAVLGDMLELGENEVREHLVSGAYLHRAGIEMLIAVGPLAAEMADGALGAGMDPESVVCVPDSQAALSELTAAVRPGDLVLVKGSRGVKMETIVDGLTQQFTPLVRPREGK